MDIEYILMHNKNFSVKTSLDNRVIFDSVNAYITHWVILPFSLIKYSIAVLNSQKNS